MWSDDLKQAVDALAEALQQFSVAVVKMLGDLVKLAEEAQVTIDERVDERKRWGHPPKRLIVTYKQPVRKIRPYARSICKRKKG